MENNNNHPEENSKKQEIQKRPAQQTYLEKEWEGILKIAHLSKAQLCREMGVKPQNFDSLIKTKNAITLAKLGDVIGLPVRALIDGQTDDMKDKDMAFGCFMINNRLFFIKDKADFLLMLRSLYPDKPLPEEYIPEAYRRK